MDLLPDPQFKTADGSALRIWRDSAQNKFLSEQEGRPIFDEVIYCEVIAPGSRDSSPVFELTRDFHKLMNHPDRMFGPKFPELREFVERFEKDEAIDISLSGTPLSQWSEMPRTMVSALKAQSIFTVDALAELPDTKLGLVGPDGRSWKMKAQAYIETAKNAAYATELAAKVEVLSNDLAAEKQNTAALSARVAELEGDLAKKGKTTTTAAKAEPSPAEPII